MFENSVLSEYKCQILVSYLKWGAISTNVKLQYMLISFPQKILHGQVQIFDQCSIK